MKRYLTSLLPSYPAAIVYMLQSVEYQTKPYLKWYRRTKDFRSVTHRRSLVRTSVAKMLLIAMNLGIFVQLALAGLVTGFGIALHNIFLVVLGLLLVLSYPLVWGYLIIVAAFFGRLLIINPKTKKLVSQTEQIFKAHPGLIIAVLGSYGKTSMKELLNTVLAEGKKVAATPANMNVVSSHAKFAKKLTGGEEVLIVEFGEGKPGDIAQFASIVHPDKAVITGLAPAHLDQYPTLEAAGQDIFSIEQYVRPANIYVNHDSPAATAYIKKDFQLYDAHQALGWQIKDVKLGFDGVHFKMSKNGQVLNMHTALMGRHQVGPVAFVAALAHELGLTNQQIEKGVGQTAPFEHRMQPRSLHGAWIIDDTYNGNIDGMRAGLSLLADLPAKRRIYVTPGLVDQGVETESVHVQLGEAIARANPDLVVLMKNSVTHFIQHGLQKAGYKGSTRVEEDPLNYYQNLEHFIAAGDVVMMQNDWTDNYN